MEILGGLLMVAVAGATALIVLVPVAKAVAESAVCWAERRAKRSVR